MQAASVALCVPRLGPCRYRVMGPRPSGLSLRSGASCPSAALICAGHADFLAIAFSFAPFFRPACSFGLSSVAASPRAAGCARSLSLRFVRSAVRGHRGVSSGCVSRVGGVLRLRVGCSLLATQSGGGTRAGLSSAVIRPPTIQLLGHTVPACGWHCPQLMWWLRPHSPLNLRVMAIFTPAGGTVVPKSANGMTFTTGAQGQPVINAATNNRRGYQTGRVLSATAQGTNFKILDSLILNLDAMYDQLTNKADWIAASDTFAGLWSLCASCMPDHGAKKFYRQYNYYRSILDLGTTSIPPPHIESGSLDGVEIAFFDATLGTPHFVINRFGQALNFNFVANIGLGTSNPYAFITDGDSGPEIAAGPLFDMLRQTLDAISAGIWSPPSQTFGFDYCTFGASGEPGNHEGATIIVFSM